MDGCNAALAFILLSPSVSAIRVVHSIEIAYFLKFLSLYVIHLIIDRTATPTFTQTK